MGTIGSVCVWLGAALVVLAIVGYLYFNNERFRKWLQTTREQAVRVKEEVVMSAQRPASEDLTTTEQFRDLHEGEFVEFAPEPDALHRPEHQVTGRGTHKALNRRGTNFPPRGEEYPVYILDERHMLFERPDGWFVFDEAIVLDGESARAFDAAGEAFSAKGQEPHSHSFTWRGNKLAVLDVGYMKYQHGAGNCHLPNGAMIKYMLAELPDKRVLYLENQKVGTDRVWIGKALGQDLKPFVGKVLRATA